MMKTACFSLKRFLQQIQAGKIFPAFFPREGRAVAALFLGALFLLLPLLPAPAALAETVSETRNIEDAPRSDEAWPSLDYISASAYLVVDAESGESILEHNPDGIVYPASMTKILTALTVIESPDFDPLRPVRFSDLACMMPAAESATAGFLPGEECPTIAVLYAMMLRSANEAANALAETYGGTIDDFVGQMNRKAAEMGCENTHFVDPCGFGGADHYTTARDLVLITRTALQNRLFQKLVTTRHYSIPPTNLHPASGWSNLLSGNYLLLFQDAGYQSPYLRSIDGVKTGMTDIAGECLTAAATTTNDRHLISVMFNAVYTGEYTNSYIGPAIMSRQLLQEAAIRTGAPYQEDKAAGDPLTYGWPTLEDKAAAPEAESQALVSYTVVAVAAETEAEVPGQIRMQSWQVLLLIVFGTVFLLISLLLFYALSTERKRFRARCRDWRE